MKALLWVGLPDVADVREDEEHIIDESDATRCGSGSGGGGGEGGCGGGGSDGGSSDDDAWL